MGLARRAMDRLWYLGYRARHYYNSFQLYMEFRPTIWLKELLVPGSTKSPIVVLESDAHDIVTTIRNYLDAESFKVVARRGRMRVIGFPDDDDAMAMSRQYTIGGCAHCCLAEVASLLLPGVAIPEDAPHWKRKQSELNIERQDEAFVPAYTWPVFVDYTSFGVFRLKDRCSKRD